MKAITWVLGLSLLAAMPARAEEDDAARVARWGELKHAVFGDRAVSDGAGVILLDAPTRALDASVVPNTVTLPGPEKVRALYIMVDGNPSPLAVTFHFGPAAAAHVLKTRVRVDQYTLMHAVAETEDGRLFGAERFVKAAGGCSAPSLKDPQQALARIGQMRLHVEDNAAVEDGRPAIAQLLISHPNNNGMQVDQLSHNFVPARFIQDMQVRYGDTLVFSADTDISLSEDPAITFDFVPRGPGPLGVEVRDSTKAVFRHSFDLVAAKG